MLLDTFVFLQILIYMPKSFCVILFIIILVICLYAELLIYGLILGKKVCLTLDKDRNTKKDSK